GTGEGVLQTGAGESWTERPPLDPPIRQADLSPDERFLAARRGGRVDLIDMMTGKTERTLAETPSELESLSFSPDGRVIAGFGGWGFFKTSLRLWDSSSGRELPLAGDPAGSVRSIACRGA